MFTILAAVVENHPRTDQHRHPFLDRLGDPQLVLQRDQLVILLLDLRLARPLVLLGDQPPDQLLDPQLVLLDPQLHNPQGLRR